MCTFPNWNNLLTTVIANLANGQSSYTDYLTANSDAIKQALNSGGRVVVNMSSAHIPSFIEERKYKNCYEIDAKNRIGEEPSTSKKRHMVDEALEPLHHTSIEDIYFAAIELNGYGVSFYGDFCLVLKGNISENNTVVLDRNSYDLIREPLQSRITKYAKNNNITDAAARKLEAAQHAGHMHNNLAPIAAIKVLEPRQTAQRLMTTGTISDGVLNDEDYIEVLRTKTFDVNQVEEVRLTPADVALEERIRSHALVGEPPSLAEALWRKRRRTAETRLRAQNVPVRVVTSAGRVKG